ncbi:MAG: thiamine pyrophosphate-binding protein [Anaerolineae bacterium]|nr:thiamine pyrophosphate-binding protein [Anaerolineae bacterium]
MTQTIAEVMAQTLRGEGVDVVFGLPGGENVPLVAALDNAGIRFIMVRHESRAVWAADAYARIGRRAGVCLSTLGPGAANLAAGLAHAFLDRAPVLAITAQLPSSLIEHHSHQRLDLQAVFQPVTKASTIINENCDTAEIVSRALHLTRQGRMGPVHLQVSSPVSMHAAETSGRSTGDMHESDNMLDSLVTGMAALLTGARRPAIVVGLAIEPGASYAQMVELAEILQAPVIVTPKAKGAIPERHRLYGGVLGLERQEASADTLRHADMILGIGFDPVELMVPWSFKAPYIHLSPAPNADPYLPAVLTLEADISEVLQRLVPAVNAVRTAVYPAWWTPQHHVPAPKQRRLRPAISNLLLSQVIHAARELLPGDGIVTVDVGAHKLMIGKKWEAQQPNRFLLSNGLSTMGYALPAAIGAKLARPQAPVVCFTGDGGLGMVASELETAVRLNLPIVVVVLADEAMSLIRLKQLASGYQPVGTLMGPTDWVKVARGYGAHGVAVDNEKAFCEAFSHALAARTPTLIEARIDPAEYQTY